MKGKDCQVVEKAPLPLAGAAPLVGAKVKRSWSTVECLENKGFNKEFLLDFPYLRASALVTVRNRGSD